MAERSDRRALLGVLFLLVGAVLIIDNFNIFPYFYIPSYFFGWYMILIIIGIGLIISKGNNSAGFVLLGIGGLFLSMRAFHFSWHDIGGFWPIVFVLIGIGLLIRNSKGPDKVGSEGEKKNDLSYLDELTIFGGTKKIINSQEFEGGKTTTLFGGTELILQNALPIPGGAVIDTFTMFGGTDVIVPSDWEVKIEAHAIFGGIDDKRETAQSIVKPDPTKILIIKGFVAFGGVEIKSYA